MSDGTSGVRGHVAPGYEAVRDALVAMAEADPTHCAQFAAFRGAEPVVDLVCGPWDRDALLPVFSCGKGAIGVTVALLVQRGLLDLDARVARYWPEFAAAGKREVTVRQLLSHQAGVPTVDGGFTAGELLAHDGLAHRLAAQRPFWHPGSAFAYHAVTIGTLADELVRRITGRTLSEVFGEDIAAPRGIDVHLGAGPELDPRVVSVDLPTDEELEKGLATVPLTEPDSLGAMLAPTDVGPVWTWINTEEPRRGGPAALAGLASAHGLARMYAALGNDVGAPRVADADVIAQISQVQVEGHDLLSGLPFRYGVLFQRPLAPRLAYGSSWAFGHDGLGGSVGVGDPFHDLAFGYTVKRITLPPCCDARALRLMDAVRAAAAG
ncbi:serine hydrolase domain-containing protein [Thermomonospora umbrina]|uniref:CubicO group peptidase (Beta-lactamase class C family) n=1 Tax=Thermomonospora umbrina TaxID=111806 RepID=A0A3D9T6B5_9ACTN|nr:serine hydrolase domain-containing protein [Thermomonospora umbrina]REF00786.1 CubicO group peptidase (beta-lactamase class C family) [Thermomonospora umbrina]